MESSRMLLLLLVLLLFVCLFVCSGREKNRINLMERDEIGTKIKRQVCVCACFIYLQTKLNIWPEYPWKLFILQCSHFYLVTTRQMYARLACTRWNYKFCRSIGEQQQYFFCKSEQSGATTTTLAAAALSLYLSAGTIILWRIERPRRKHIMDCMEYPWEPYYSHICIYAWRLFYHKTYAQMPVLHTQTHAHHHT